MKKYTGTTLIEILVAISILAAVSALGLHLFQSVTNTQTQLSHRVVLQMEARKAFSKLVSQIQEGTDIIRPAVGETLPFLVIKDIVKDTVIFYLDPNEKLAELLAQRVYKLVSYKSEYTIAHNTKNEKCLLKAVKAIKFTRLSASTIQAVVTVVNQKGSSQFITNISLINVGDK